MSLFVGDHRQEDLIYFNEWCIHLFLNFPFYFHLVLLCDFELELFLIIFPPLKFSSHLAQFPTGSFLLIHISLVDLRIHLNLFSVKVKELLFKLFSISPVHCLITRLNYHSFQLALFITWETLGEVQRNKGKGLGKSGNSESKTGVIKVIEVFY